MPAGIDAAELLSLQAELARFAAWCIHVGAMVMGTPSWYRANFNEIRKGAHFAIGADDGW